MTKTEKTNHPPVPPRDPPAARRGRRVVQPIGAAPSRTRQEFKDDCDINRILAKYQRTGALNHFAKYSAQYGDFTACELQEAYALIQRARQMFDALPSTIRQEVSTPEGFLAFVQNPANAARMRELGLTNAPLPPSPPPPAATPTG